jgi:hypothetical protein
LLQYQGIKENPKQYFDLILPLLKSTNPFIKSRSIWLIANMEERGITKTLEILKTGTEQERIVALRALRQNAAPKDLLKILSNLSKDNSAFVRREAILALQIYPYEEIKNILKIFAENNPKDDPFYTNALVFVLTGNENNFYKENSILFGQQFNLAFALFPSAALGFFEETAKNSNENILIRKKALTAIAFIKTKEAVNAMLKLSKSEDKEVSETAKYWLTFRSTNDWFDLHNWSSMADDIQNQKNLNRLFSKKEIVLNENIAFGDRKNAAFEMLKSTQGSQMLLELIQNQKISADIIEYCGPLLINHLDPTIKYQSKNILSEVENTYNLDNILKLKGNIENGKKVFDSAKNWQGLCLHEWAHGARRHGSGAVRCNQ